MSILPANPSTPAHERTLWRTPRALVCAARARWLDGQAFALDCAATDETVSVGTRHLSPADDALADGGWMVRAYGDNVKRSGWLNSPYGRGGLTGRWTDRAIVEADGCSLLAVLVPEATDTGWWRRLYARADEALSCGRVPFLRPDGTPGDSPPQGYTLFALRPLCDATLGASLRVWNWRGK